MQKVQHTKKLHKQIHKHTKNTTIQHTKNILVLKQTYRKLKQTYRKNKHTRN